MVMVIEKRSKVDLHRPLLPYYANLSKKFRNCAPPARNPRCEVCFCVIWSAPMQETVSQGKRRRAQVGAIPLICNP